MFGLGAPELILIIVAIFVLFGAKKIPELMRGIGTGIKEFKQAANGDAPKEKSESEPKSDNKEVK